MARYVDIENNEALINAMHDLFVKCNFKHKQGCLAPTCKECLKRFFSKDYGYLLPTADVKEVVRGEWIKKYDDFSQSYDEKDKWYFVCSNCKLGTDKRYSFCPNCGADMRGDK